MIKGLARWFGISTPEDDLVSLMMVASEDPDIGSQLLSILEQEDFQRQSLLGTWIYELELSQAPKPLIRALKSLIDNDRAHHALAVLRERIQAEKN